MVPYYTAEKHHPTMFHTATVRPTRSGPNILYNTSLSFFEKNIQIQSTSRRIIFKQRSLLTKCWFWMKNKAIRNLRLIEVSQTSVSDSCFR